MRSRGSISRWCLSAFIAVWGAVGCVSRASSNDDLDRQLLESLEQPANSTQRESLVTRLLQNTQTAQQRLADGRFDAETTALQQRILEDFDALLKHSGSPPPESPPSPSESGSNSPHPQPDSTSTRPPDTAEPQTAGEAAAGGQALDGNPNAAARESAERTTPGEHTAQERERRLGLATAVWGHLPPKERERMRSAFSETYLPQYDELVRRYYEALATQRTDREPAADRPAPH